MPNAEHVAWLLEGAERWNSGREQMNFAPDFESEDLYVQFQQPTKNRVRQ